MFTFHLQYLSNKTSAFYKSVTTEEKTMLHFNRNSNSWEWRFISRNLVFKHSSWLVTLYSCFQLLVVECCRFAFNIQQQVSWGNNIYRQVSCNFLQFLILFTIILLNNKFQNHNFRTIYSIKLELQTVSSTTCWLIRFLSVTLINFKIFILS